MSSDDLDQPAHLHSLIKSLLSAFWIAKDDTFLDAKKKQQILLSGCADAQAD